MYIIEKGAIFYFDNLVELQQFSESRGNPKKGEFKVDFNNEKKFIVTKQ